VWIRCGIVHPLPARNADVQCRGSSPHGQSPYKSFPSGSSTISMRSKWVRVPAIAPAPTARSVTSAALPGHTAGPTRQAAVSRDDQGVARSPGGPDDVRNVRASPGAAGRQPKERRMARSHPLTSREHRRDNDGKGKAVSSPGAARRAETSSPPPERSDGGAVGRPERRRREDGREGAPPLLVLGSHRCASSAGQVHSVVMTPWLSERTAHRWQQGDEYALLWEHRVTARPGPGCPPPSYRPCSSPLTKRRDAYLVASASPSHSGTARPRTSTGFTPERFHPPSSWLTSDPGH
jgi:hypothetical protein